MSNSAVPVTMPDWPVLIRELLDENAALRENTSGNADVEPDPNRASTRAALALDVAPPRPPERCLEPDWPDLLDRVLSAWEDSTIDCSTVEALAHINAARTALASWKTLPSAHELVTRRDNWTIEVTGSGDDDGLNTERYIVKDDIGAAVTRAAQAFAEQWLTDDDGSPAGDLVEIFVRTGGVAL